MTALLGEEPINPEKHLLEGGWSSVGIQLGVGSDTESGKMWVPAAKVEKGYHTVNQEGLQYGKRRVPLLAVQQLAGILQSWLVVLPGVA